jgi:hypothetical protein
MFSAHLGFVLKVNVAPPAEQDQRDVERECCARQADLGTKFSAADTQVVEEG